MGQNYFTYKGKYYLQNEGLPMESPTSPTLANIFTENFENSLFKSRESSKILFWYKYVAFYAASNRELNHFSTYINIEILNSH